MSAVFVLTCGCGQPHPILVADGRVWTPVATLKNGAAAKRKKKSRTIAERIADETPRYACDGKKGCGRGFHTPQARGLHRRRAHGITGGRRKKKASNKENV